MSILHTGLAEKPHSSLRGLRAAAVGVNTAQARQGQSHLLAYAAAAEFFGKMTLAEAFLTSLKRHRSVSACIDLEELTPVGAASSSTGEPRPSEELMPVGAASSSTVEPRPRGAKRNRAAKR